MKGNEPAHVLVVDDESELRELLVDALTGPDFHVTAVGSGKEAIDLVRTIRPDIVVTDLCLGDCTGIDVIDRVRRIRSDLPAVLITGQGDPAVLSEASSRRPVEMLTKPLNLDRLRKAICDELSRQQQYETTRRRSTQLRRLARKAHLESKHARGALNSACADLTAAYRNLSGQMSQQQAMIDYQMSLIAARNDDDVFRNLFRMFVRRTGSLFGIAMVCNAEAELRIVGRFGVPTPDSLAFCERFSKPLVDAVLAEPQCTLMEPGDKAELWDESVRRFLPGISALAIPLLPTAGEMIGVVVLYRKGEQPFTDDDIALANLVAHPTALAVRRND